MTITGEEADTFLNQMEKIMPQLCQSKISKSQNKKCIKNSVGLQVVPLRNSISSLKKSKKYGVKSHRSTIPTTLMLMFEPKFMFKSCLQNYSFYIEQSTCGTKNLLLQHQILTNSETVFAEVKAQKTPHVKRKHQVINLKINEEVLIQTLGTY